MMMRKKRMKMVMRAERTSHRCTRSALPSVPAIRQIPPGNRGYGDYDCDDGDYHHFSYDNDNGVVNDGQYC